MNKKIPMRTCIACRTAHPKRELIRVVKFNDEISLDLTGKANGRGAYVCNNEECIKKLKKTKALSRAFSMNVSDDVYIKIEEQFLGK